MVEPALSPLATTLHFEAFIAGCVTRSNKGALETVVFEGNNLVPLRGSDRREGLALGQHRSLRWLPGRDLEGLPLVRLYEPVWDPFSGSAYGSMLRGHAIVRVLHDASAVVVAGSVEAGCRGGPGASARFTHPWSLATDGQGAMYCLDDGRVWKLTLPAAWKKPDHDNSESGPVAAAVAAAAPAPGERRGHAAQAGGGGGGGVQGQGPQEQEQGQHHEQVQVSILPCGQPNARTYYYMAYDPLCQALVLAGHQTVYHRALTEGAAEELVLLAGCEGVGGGGDGVGAEARFRSIEGLVVDGAGAALVLDCNDNEETTTVRRVGPDGKVTTIARDLPGLWHAPAILPNGYLALCDNRPTFEGRPPSQLLVLDLGLTPNACHAAAPPPPPAGPKPHTLPADLSALLASASQPGDGSADVVVRVGDRGFHAHRAVLRARSAYFRQRLDPGAGFEDAEQQQQQQQQPQQQQYLSLPDASPDAFELVLRYMYTDSVGDIPGALLQPAAELADRLLLPGLCEEVGRQMMAAVCAESVVGLLLWAEQRSASFGELLLGLKVWFGEHREVVVALPVHTKRLWVEAPDLAYELFFDAAGGGTAKRQRVQ